MTFKSEERKAIRKQKRCQQRITSETQIECSDQVKQVRIYANQQLCVTFHCPWLTEFSDLQCWLVNWIEERCPLDGSAEVWHRCGYNSLTWKILFVYKM